MRNRYFDLLRAVAIGRVVLYHTFGYAWLTIIFPAMGLMFALGGSLMAASMDRSGNSAVGRRLRRILPPLAVLAVVAIVGTLLTGHALDPKLLLWFFPLFHPPTNDWGGQWLGMIWYIREYLWFVLLSPLLLPAFRRWPVVSLAVPFVLLAFLTFTGLKVNPVISDFALYAPAWMLGFAQYHRTLEKLSKRLVWTIAGVTGALGLGWLFTHPGPRGFDINDVPLANALWSGAFLLVLLRMLQPVVPQTAIVDVVNRRAITVYLWHEGAIALVTAGALAVGVSLLGFSGAVTELLAVVVLLVLVVAAIGWIEDLAARRTPELWPAEKTGKPRAKPLRQARPTINTPALDSAAGALYLSAPRAF